MRYKAAHNWISGVQCLSINPFTSDHFPSPVFPASPPHLLLWQTLLFFILNWNGRRQNKCLNPCTNPWTSFTTSPGAGLLAASLLSNAPCLDNEIGFCTWNLAVVRNSETLTLSWLRNQGIKEAGRSIAFLWVSLSKLGLMSPWMELKALSYSGKWFFPQH